MSREMFVQYTKLGAEAVPWREGGLVPPGENTTVTVFMPPGDKFRARCAMRVLGIDYSVFKIQVYVGDRRQGDSPFFPAERLFQSWPQPWDEAQFGIDVTFVLLNEDRVALPFAVTLVE